MLATPCIHLAPLLVPGPADSYGVHVFCPVVGDTYQVEKLCTYSIVDVVGRKSRRKLRAAIIRTRSSVEIRLEVV